MHKAKMTLATMAICLSGVLLNGCGDNTTSLSSSEGKAAKSALIFLSEARSATDRIHSHIESLANDINHRQASRKRQGSGYAGLRTPMVSFRLTDEIESLTESRYGSSQLKQAFVPKLQSLADDIQVLGSEVTATNTYVKAEDYKDDKGVYYDAQLAAISQRLPPIQQSLSALYSRLKTEETQAENTIIAAHYFPKQAKGLQQLVKLANEMQMQFRDYSTFEKAQAAYDQLDTQVTRLAELPEMQAGEDITIDPNYLQSKQSQFEELIKDDIQLNYLAAVRKSLRELKNQPRQAKKLAEESADDLQRSVEQFQLQYLNWLKV